MSAYLEAPAYAAGNVTLGATLGGAKEMTTGGFTYTPTYLEVSWHWSSTDHRWVLRRWHLAKRQGSAVGISGRSHRDVPDGYAEAVRNMRPTGLGMH